MRVKFILYPQSIDRIFHFSWRSIFPSQPTPMRRGFAYQTWVKSYFCATQKPPRKKHSPRREIGERSGGKNVQPKITQFTDTHQHIHCAVDKKKANEGKCFSDVENVHNALNTIKCDNMAGCGLTHSQPPFTRRPFAVLCHYTKKKDSHTTQHQIYPSHLAFKYRGFMCSQFSYSSFLQDVGVDVWVERRMKIQNYNKRALLLLARLLAFACLEAWLLSKQIYAEKRTAEGRIFASRFAFAEEDEVRKVWKRDARRTFELEMVKRERHGFPEIWKFPPEIKMQMANANDLNFNCWWREFVRCINWSCANYEKLLETFSIHFYGGLWILGKFGEI